MLTNDVQLSYAKTEGYVPVTQKAQDTADYRDYLSREGEDNDMYYDVKIKASKLLIDNVENTFVTPVFNGSASLRDAAGYLIESVVKGILRKKEINETFMDTLYSDTQSLYRLDQIDIAATGKRDLGPLPATGVALLTALSVTWGLIAVYAGYIAVKKAKSK